MNFISTRNKEEILNSAQAIIKGLSNSGGLYVPEEFPNLTGELERLKKLDYQDLALEIINNFFEDLGKENIKKAVDNAYKDKFLVELNNNCLELYHGPTSAFKDAALLFLPQIMKVAKKQLNVKEDIVILTATSGDTGKAALEGFKDVEGLKVMVFYPKDGVSDIQKYQMITQEGENVSVIAIEGNFDDAQRGVKEIFSNNKLRDKLKEKSILLSSANSINIGRLIPQIVYYFYGYFDLINKNCINNGDKINVAVPTGNFGNILAAYYAKKMGLPINKFICASNENNVLTDFINTGIYDKRRELILTKSPSMDILISSNLERLLFELCDRDDKEVVKFMNDLESKGTYEINNNMRKKMADFYGYYSKEEEVLKDIREVFEKKNYLMDTHTAVAYGAYKQYYNDTNDDTVSLIVSTASPFKFTKSIMEALNQDIDNRDDFQLLEDLSKISNLEIPVGLRDLDKKKVLHHLESHKENMKDLILNILEIDK